MLAAASNFWRHLLFTSYPDTGENFSVIIVPEVSCDQIRGFLNLLYLGRTDFSTVHQLDNLVKLVGYLLPELAVISGASNCLFLESATVNKSNSYPVESVVKYQDINEETEQLPLEHELEGYHKTGQTDLMIRWTKSTDDELETGCTDTTIEGGEEHREQEECDDILLVDKISE